MTYLCCSICRRNMKEFVFKQTTLQHKNLVNFQFDVLGVKSGTMFYQRQCAQAKLLLMHYSYEDLLNVLKFFALTSLPKGYKSIYFLGHDTDTWIYVAKQYIASLNVKSVATEQSVENTPIRKKVQLEFKI